jgi:hypothetical protein
VSCDDICSGTSVVMIFVVNISEDSFKKTDVDPLEQLGAVRGLKNKLCLFSSVRNTIFCSNK